MDAEEVGDFYLRNRYYCFNLSPCTIFKTGFNYKTMKIISRNLAALVCASFVIWTISCTSKQDEKDNAQEFDQAAEELKEQIEEIVYQIPPPAEIPYILQSTGVEVDESLVNNLNKADKYQGTDDKSAMNLGVYATDIGYLSSYEKAQEALTYFTKIKGLADQIGVTTSIDAKVIDRFEKNLASKDSLTNIINEAIHNTDKHLKNSGRNRTAALVLTGSFIEGLYIATSLVKNYPRDILTEENRKLILIPLVRLILDQEKPLNDLHAMLGSLESDQTLEELLGMTSELLQRYDALDIQQKISNNEGVTLLEDKNLAGVTEQINAIRTFITG